MLELSLTLVGAVLPVVLTMLEITGSISSAVTMAALLFWPGFAVTQWFWPESNQLSLAQRLSFTPLFSLLIILLTVLLAWVTMQSLAPIIIYSLIFGVTAAIVAIAATSRSNLASLIPLRREFGVVLAMFALFVGLIVAAVEAPQLGFHLSSSPTNSHDQMSGGFTTFYLARPEASAPSQPLEVVAGQPTAIEVGISNHEGIAMVYRVLVKIGDQTVGSLVIQLDDSAVWEGPVGFTPTVVGDDQEVQVILERQGLPGSYRFLQLRVNVIPSLLPRSN